MDPSSGKLQKVAKEGQASPETKYAKPKKTEWIQNTDTGKLEKVFID